MNDNLNRREAVGLFAMAGSLAFGLPAVVRVDDKPMAEFDEQAERKRIIAAGLTEAEADCWVLIAKSAGKFFELPKLHPMDDHEVAHAIHVVQHKLLSRPAYRRYKELAQAEKK
jgi:hypothetical protein